MKKAHTLLAYYSFILGTALLVWALIWAPRPGGFVLAVLVFPLSIYFWVLASGKMPHDQSSMGSEIASVHQSMGLLLALVMTVATASILMFLSFGLRGEQADTTTQNPNIEKRLTRIQSSLSQLDDTSLAIEKLNMKVTLMQSALLRLENKKGDTLIEDELQGILEATPTATPEAIFTP